jgi:uncharacterized damage-inducible protein DinB
MNVRSLISMMALVCLFLSPNPVSAQDGASFQDSFMRHFNSSARKFLALADAMPAEKYGWSPNDETMSVELVFMHIARYNYNYLHTYLGAELPAGIDLDTMEEITGKDEVLKHLKDSIDYVRNQAKEMGVAVMSKETRLYGRDMEGWGVFLQLITHMNEHLGQSIAYARMNDVAPPWSR